MEALVEFWNLWWRRKKMKVKVWRSGGGCLGGDEEEMEVWVLMKRMKRRMK